VYTVTASPAAQATASGTAESAASKPKFPLSADL